MKPTKEQLADSLWWRDNAPKGAMFAYYCKDTSTIWYRVTKKENCTHELLAKRPEPENKKIYWVAKVDCYGTPWNTDGPHESYSKANEGCELLKQVNKKDKYIVTEMTFKKIKTQREELIDIILLANNMSKGSALATANLILHKFTLTNNDGE